MSDSYDSPWKEMLEAYLPELLAFFFPEIHHDIDWSRGWESLDQELPKVVRQAELGGRVVDKLFKVWRRDGDEQLVLIHIEVQNDQEPGFPKRMYVSNYRIFDRYDTAVVSLAILTDDRAGWRPDEYLFELWGCRVSFAFPTAKLLDYNDSWDELEASGNPFATVVMTHLKTRATRRNPKSRLRWKVQLVRRLYRGGFERQDVLELFRFIDWLMVLPAELEERFQVDHRSFEEELKMPYVTNIERRGIAQGIQQGIQQGIERGIKQGVERGIERGIEQGIRRGEVQLLKRLLERRFQSLPNWVESRLRDADTAELERWGERILEARQLEDVFSTP